jgi:hypothetical protein
LRKYHPAYIYENKSEIDFFLGDKTLNEDVTKIGHWSLVAQTIVTATQVLKQ